LPKKNEQINLLLFQVRSIYVNINAYFLFLQQGLEVIFFINIYIDLSRDEFRQPDLPGMRDKLSQRSCG
jgi:hypothetical protein